MIEKKFFKGIIPATITPMKNDYTLDLESFDNYLKWIIEQGVKGLAVNVDTGEGPTLSMEEKTTLLEMARERLGNSKLLVAGLISASTKEAELEASYAKDVGADVMLVFPNVAFRGTPSDPEAIKKYYHQIANNADIDLMLFLLQDALGGIEYDEKSIRAITSIDRVVAVKEATFDFSKFKKHLKLFREMEKENNREIAFLTGNDNFIFESFLWECDGALIGAAAQDTKRIVECYEASMRRDWSKAINLCIKFQPLIDVVFAPPVREYRSKIKACLYLQGVISTKTVRPPLTEVSKEELLMLKKELIKAGLKLDR